MFANAIETETVEMQDTAITYFGQKMLEISNEKFNFWAALCKTESNF